MATQQSLHAQYNNIKLACAQSHLSHHSRQHIKDFCHDSLDFLVNHSQRVQLISRVPHKDYHSYRANGAVARPANSNLFIADVPAFARLWAQWEVGAIQKPDLLKLLYTAALAPCLVMELFDKQNKKGPATFFECFIGNLVSTQINQEPEKKASFSVQGLSVRLTMDFLFAPQGGRPGIHLPVKMSTRERVVQAWSHQRLLDSAFGVGAYSGLMILFSETKLDSRSLEVVEICVPAQWLAYQSHLARMDKIYYFDVPDRYLRMAQSHAAIMHVDTIEQFIR